MSYLDKMSELKIRVNRVKESENKDLDIIKIYCSVYIFVKSKKQKELLLKNGVYILNNKFSNLKNIAQHILDKNIIIERKNMEICNWIIIDHNIIVRKINIQKGNNGYVVSQIKYSPRMDYRDLIQI